MNIKSMLIGGVVPLVTLVNAEAGKELGDLQTILADGKVTGPEAVTIITDSIATAKSFWPAGAPALDSLQQNLVEDLPAEEKIVQDVERTINLFKQVAAGPVPTAKG